MNVTRLLTKGPADRPRLAREYQLRAGYDVVVPGEVTWLPLEDWRAESVVSIDGRHVRLVELYARRPGCGAFRRLISALIANGLTPNLIDPPPRLENTLGRWGWVCNEFGHGLEREDVWRPPGR